MFGSYDIIETVGQGGMGIVYRAMDVALEREVAVKVLKEDLRTHPQVVARFQREAEAFASLNHPNIVHIYTVGSVGKIPFIAMEFIRGEPLSDIMKRERRMDWKRALYLGEQIAKGLSTAHDSHIIHRDIKPGNILVTKDDHAFVTDFGIAKVLTAETQLTVEGSRLGTPQYMSPERCRNEDATASSDLYSLGVLLFQMISGRLPYEASNPVELVHKIISQPPKRLSEYLPAVPPDVERLVAYLIEKDPRDRPATGHDWVELSERVREGKPLFEESDGMSESMRHFRESMPTPTPASSGGTSRRTDPGLTGRARKYWRRLGSSAKLAVASVPVILAALIAGFQYDQWANRDYAHEAIAAMDFDTASWERSLDAASIVREAPGVKLVQIHMPGYAVSPVTWVDSDTALVELKGEEDTGGVALRGIGRISLASRGMELVYPPAKLRNLSVLGNNDETSRQLMASAGSGAVELFTVDTGRSPYVPGDSDDLAFGFSAPEPALGSVSAGVWSSLRNSWLIVGNGQVWEYGENFAAPVMLLAPDGRVERIVAVDSQVYLLRRSREGVGSLEAWSQAGTDETLVSLATGVNDLAGENIDVRTHRAVVSVTSEGTLGAEIHMLDGYTGEVLARMGLGTEAVWHPSGRYVLALAEDRKGNLQLCGISPEAPYMRTQLTYLNDGVVGSIRVSPDGKYAMVESVSNAEPELVLVDVSTETLSDSGL